MDGEERKIVGLTMVAHGLIHTYELSIPILVTIWLKEFGVTEAIIGLIVTAGYTLFGLGALPGGVLADIIGSKRLIVASFFGMGLSFLFLSAAPGTPAVALALLGWGAAAGVYHPSALELLSKEVSRRGTGFAYHGIAGSVGVAAGPFALALLLQVFNWRQAAAAIALPAMVAGAAALRANVRETTERGDSDRGRNFSLDGFLRDSRELFSGAFVVVFLAVILSGLYYRGVLTFLPGLISQFPGFEPMEFAGREWEPSRYLYAGILLVGVFGQYAGGKLSDRIPENPEHGLALGFGVLAGAAVLFLPAANAGFGPFLSIGALLGFFMFFVQPVYQAAVAENTEVGARGTSYGYMYLGTFGIGSFGGAIAGAILTYLTQDALFLVLASIAAVASALGLVLGAIGRLEG